MHVEVKQTTRPCDFKQLSSQFVRTKTTDHCGMRARGLGRSSQWNRNPLSPLPVDLPHHVCTPLFCLSQSLQ